MEAVVDEGLGQVASLAERRRQPVGHLLPKYFHQIRLLRSFVDYGLDSQLFHHPIALVLRHARDAEAFFVREANVKFRAAIRGTLRSMRSIQFQRGFPWN